MKKMIITIIILLIIFISMVISRNIEKSEEININEVEKIESYIKEIYGWQEVTGEALPEFNNINEANEEWLYGIIRKNLEEEEVTYEQIENKKQELYGKSLNKNYPEEGSKFITYDEDLQIYTPSVITLDAINDTFYLNKIERTNDGYNVEIIEYLVDYTDEESEQISIKNLTGEEISKASQDVSNEEIVEIVKNNIDKFSKKKIALKEEDGNIIVEKVEKVEKVEN